MIQRLFYTEVRSQSLESILEVAGGGGQPSNIEYKYLMGTAQSAGNIILGKHGSSPRGPFGKPLSAQFTSILFVSLSLICVAQNHLPSTLSICKSWCRLPSLQVISIAKRSWSGTGGDHKNCVAKIWPRPFGSISGYLRSNS